MSDTKKPTPRTMSAKESHKERKKQEQKLKVVEGGQKKASAREVNTRTQSSQQTAQEHLTDIKKVSAKKAYAELADDKTLKARIKQKTTTTKRASSSGASTAQKGAKRSTKSTHAKINISDKAAKRLKIALGVVGVAVLMGLFFYNPVRDAYVAQRNNEILQQRLELKKQYQEQLNADVDALQTEQGVEDEAHKLGYVKPDEQIANIQGLSSDQEAQNKMTDEKIAQQVQQEQEQKPWYIKLLDKFFNYNPKEH